MSAMYDKGREAFGNALIDWVDDTIQAALVDLGAYTPNLSTDEFLSIIPGAALIGSAVALANKTNVSGVMDADDVSFTGLVAAPSIEALVLFKWTGSAATSRLIAFIDSAQSGLPVTAGSIAASVAWSNGANKIFKL